MTDGAYSAAESRALRLLPDRGGPLQVAGLFAGIGGIEQGMHEAGHRSVLLCEVMEEAKTVLRARFPGVPLIPDVNDLRPEDIAEADVVTAGFPCQDLSQAGRTEGIRGEQSGLIQRVFALLEKLEDPPKWLVLENVTFMLHLDRGEGMRYLARSLRKLGYRWAYRVVDTRAFGLPQRRQRVILVASKHDDLDPRGVLFVDEKEPRPDPDFRRVACGFYWTEGLRGLGWAVDAVPTLKGGSTIGIPSPPAIWMPERELTIVKPGIRDAERLQGFPAGWTKAAGEGGTRRSKNARWKLVGNAVSVPVAEWLGRRLAVPGDYDNARTSQSLHGRHKWPKAAWGDASGTFEVEISIWPERRRYKHLRNFLGKDLEPLSARATAGFYERAKRGNLNFDKIPGFLDAVERHRDMMLERG
ncbi:MAG: DNA (cytosine-5-)-methyltransferase [Myxococcota bacterium]